MKDLRNFFSAVAKMFVHSMPKIEKEEVEYPMLFYLIAGEFNIRWQHLFLQFNYKHFSAM